MTIHDELPEPGYATHAELVKGAGIRAVQATVKAKLNSRSINERERRALELLVAGATCEQIGVVLGIKRAGAVQLVQRALAKRALEFNSAQTYEQARVLYVDRLEKLYARWLPVALGNVTNGVPPDPRGAEIVLKIMEREARVLGLETSPVVEVHTTVDMTVQEADERRMRILHHLAEVEERRAQVLDGEVVDAA